MSGTTEEGAAPRFCGMSSTGKSTDSWPWVEKYRPSSLDDIIAHKEIVSTSKSVLYQLYCSLMIDSHVVVNLLIDNQRLPHLLFYGPPGTGKTSTILAAAKRMFGSQCGSMVLEVSENFTIP